MADEDIDLRLADLQSQINRRVETQQRELTDATDHLTELLRRSEELRDVKVQATWNRIDSVQREIVIAQGASDKAIIKAEIATERRLETLNELRKVVTDQAQGFVPREVADAQFAQMQKQIATNADTLSRLLGKASGSEREQDRIQPWMIWAAGAMMTVFLACLVIVVNVITSS